MRRKVGRRCDFLRAQTRGLSITAILGRENQRLLKRIVIAHGPTIVAALFEQQHFFGRQRRLLFRILDDLGPVRVQLITAVLRDKNPMSDRVDSEAFRIANARGVALRGREDLIYFLRVIAPHAAARLEFLARLYTR